MVYLEKQIRIWYVQVLIRTKYVPNTYCVFPYSLRIYVLKWAKYAWPIFLWAKSVIGLSDPNNSKARVLIAAGSDEAEHEAAKAGASAPRKVRSTSGHTNNDMLPDMDP